MENMLPQLNPKTHTLDLYRASLWCFDDEEKGIFQEPFVDGMTEILDDVAAACGLGDTMTIQFGEELDSWDYSLELICEENRGGRYYCPELDREGWLCPVIHQYFDQIPEQIFMCVQENQSSLGSPPSKGCHAKGVQPGNPQ